MIGFTPNREPSVILKMKGPHILNVALGSHNKPGLYSDLDVPDAHRCSQRELLQAVSFCLVRLMIHQNQTYLDQHNELDTIKAGKEVLSAFISAGGAKTHVNRKTFSSYHKSGQKTMDIPNPTRPNWT